MERIFGKDRLYPPIVLGDFNINYGSMKGKETTEGGVFEDFKTAGYVMPLWLSQIFSHVNRPVGIEVDR
ncbi:MAG: hypothetical protein QW358_04950 [Candidatus Hadarchaeum sp.]